MKDTPLVSLITLDYNQTDITRTFLDSTRALTFNRFEVIVVDNGSKVSSAQQIALNDYPNTRIITNKKNLGFAGGNNVGMREAKGDYVLLLNNDTEVTPGLIEAMLQPFYQDEKVGVVSPKIKFHYSPDTIQYAGFEPMNPYTGRSRMAGGKEIDRGQHDIPKETFGAHGAAMMIKRQVIEKVGMFAEEFFLYYEEWDWSTRIRRAGYKVFYQPKAVVYHKESMTVGKKSTLKVYYQTRNRILYMKRNTKKAQFAVFVVFFALCVMPKHTIGYLVKLNFAHLRAFIKGVAWHFVPKSSVQQAIR